jgi:DNA ligase D-like protein (predicted polymerase)/DNA ligase D-like protein (predicted ligase)/DNA ligase D-like protein (predicted 3'-phosphoesterase)
MPSNKQQVTVGEHTLTLSNLKKTLYPDDGLTKAEVIEYYLNISPAMLPHIQGRPLTLLRYPDGINEEHFFQKDAPRWKPDWIDFVTLGKDEENDYMIADEPAALAWLANLASLELHQMHGRRPHFNQPDYMAFDLDPPDDSGFKSVADLALNLKEHIASFGYHPFVKTSGGKGLHIVAPLKPQWEMSAVFEAAKAVARAYVQEHEDETTLQFKKEERKGRIFIDIYRNRTHQIMASPYSLRGRPGAPVSMPLRWDELPDIESAKQYHLKNAVPKVEADGDAWQDIDEYARPLHTEEDPSDPVEEELPKSDHHKSAERLEQYQQKRNFSETQEPEAVEAKGTGRRFVIQRHYASSLHYDLRLEREGVLQSWAVPKGLPPRPDIKRLAVETEDHPLEYLTFEGTIPEEEYGGGQVWVFAAGNYELTKEKEGSLHFHLNSTALSGSYHLYRTDEQKWLIEREDEPQTDWLHERIEPMHGKRTSELPKGDYTYEVKWDGVRALITLQDDEIHIHTRNKNEVTKQFPELQAQADLRASCGLFDGEMVYLQENGKPSFQKIINRLKNTAPEMSGKSNAVYCYLFDCLYLDGRPLIDEPLSRRMEWLQDVVKKDTPYRLSEAVEDGERLMKAVKEQEMEGIMAKKKDSTYHVGQRSNVWLKVKTEATADCLVIGYTKGTGERSPYFGALHLAEKKEDGSLQYRGKAGTGYNQSSLKEIDERLQQLEETGKPIGHSIQAEKDTTWVEPKLVVEVHYSELTEDNLFRSAVFERLRPDLFGD